MLHVQVVSQWQLLILCDYPQVFSPSLNSDLSGSILYYMIASMIALEFITPKIKIS